MVGRGRLPTPQKTRRTWAKQLVSCTNRRGAADRRRRGLHRCRLYLPGEARQSIAVATALVLLARGAAAVCPHFRLASSFFSRRFARHEMVYLFATKKLHNKT